MEYVHGAHTRTLLEEGYIAIEQMFDKPENNLRTAVDNEGRLEPCYSFICNSTPSCCVCTSNILRIKLRRSYIKELK